MSNQACPHVRKHTSLLASAERRALHWIARRLPESITSDHLSTLGLASMAAAGLGFAAFQWTPWAGLIVVASLIANWFGDSLDGTVARIRGLERPRYGYYIDHVIDLAGSTCLFAGLACSGLMSPLAAIVLLAAYLLVCAETYLATHATGLFRMSFFGFGPTELRLVLAAGALKAAGGGWIDLGGFATMRLFDIGAAAATAGLLMAFVVSAARNGRALHAAEPLPRPADRTRAA
jgi:archaetidylinositol phosphate synthase